MLAEGLKWDVEVVEKLIGLLVLAADRFRLAYEIEVPPEATHSGPVA